MRGTIERNLIGPVRVKEILRPQGHESADEGKEYSVADLNQTVRRSESHWS
jgi:hypothetical protein